MENKETFTINFAERGDVTANECGYNELKAFLGKLTELQEQCTRDELKQFGGDIIGVKTLINQRMIKQMIINKD